MRCLVSGDRGFLAGYVIGELLSRGWEVTGIDDESKYGKVTRQYDGHPDYRHVTGDAADAGLMCDLIGGSDHFIAGAARIGGIAYFHRYPFDLLANNEQVTAAAGQAALHGWKHGWLRKVTWISSSMVYESARPEDLPSAEGSELRIPPPVTSYGFQKLSVEYFARALRDQYNVPYTIIRPFNCVGTGELPAQAPDGSQPPSGAHCTDDSQTGDGQVPAPDPGGSHAASGGDLRLGMAHVVPELALKVLQGQDPLKILGDGTQVRHYTYGGDLGRGIAGSLNNPLAYNEDFNLASPRGTTVLELAKLIWHQVHPDQPLRWRPAEPYAHDVQLRIPDVRKAEKLLRFRASTSLEEMVGIVVAWVRQNMTGEIACR